MKNNQEPNRVTKKKDEFKCKNCGGRLGRRWSFPETAKPYTQLICEECGTITKPRNIKYGANGLIWGCKTPKDNKRKGRSRRGYYHLCSDSVAG